MRTLGVDFGLQRVGLALSDPQGRMAFPLRTLQKTSSDKLLDDLARIVEQEEVAVVVVGMPYGLNGQETLTTRQVSNFVARLKKRLAVPVETVNEALSSVEAEQELREAGLSAKKQKGLIDQQAAVIILRTFLQSKEDTLL